MITAGGLREDQVQESRQKNGANIITRKRRKGFFRFFFSNFGDPMLRILLIALGIQVVFVFNSGQWIETFGIAIAILVAVIVSTLSEYGSERAFERLQEQAAAIDCRVRRDGATIVIPVTEVVVGDIILLGAGEKIPADGILIDGELEIDQSLLNGESKEAKKTASKSEKFEQSETVDFLNPHLVFSGTVVTNGQAMMRVTEVGNKTQYGKIAAELQETVPASPLRVKLTGLAKLISIIGYIGAGMVAFSYFFNLLFIRNNFDMDLVLANLRDFPFMFEHILRAATLVVAVIVMAVPEGLPMMITVVLSSNMKHMLRDNVLVRKLNGIETAGSMNILFTDKTGTLTNGRLQVVGILDGEGRYCEIDKFDKGSELGLLLGTGLRYNTSAEIGPKGRAIGGNSTDRILLEFAGELNCPRHLKRISQVPFNSKDKFMSTTLSDGRVLYKGAAEVLLPRLKRYAKSDGTTAPIGTRRRKIDAEAEGLSSRAHRMITVAIDDIFVCMLAIRDQVRPESITATAQLNTAGIQTVMITGDAKPTAVAIAREVGIITSDSDLVMTSDGLARLTDAEVAGILPNLRVVARALPSDKSRLVRVAQSLNLVVGMTGDGVNDAPALKKADIGFAMGSGTEVAKEAGDIVILDDNINSISKGVSYGRTIFKSIRKFIIFKLTINFCAMAVSIVAPLLNVDTPITVIQMLWINLVMDTLAGLAYGGERPREEYMHEKPKRRNEAIINRYMWGQILTASVFTALLALWFLTSSFMDELYTSKGPAYAMTAFFAFFMMMNIFNAFNSRTHDVNILSKIGLNKPFIWIMGVVAIAQITMTYIGGDIFRTVPLEAHHLLLVILLGLTVIPFDMVRKLIVNSRSSVKT